MPIPNSQFGSTSHLGVMSATDSVATARKFQINYFLLPNFVIHVVGLAALWALWYYLRFTNVFPCVLLLSLMESLCFTFCQISQKYCSYHHRVFYCRDINLFKPNFNPEDFEVYISYPLLYILGFTIPPIIMLIGEVMFWLFSTKPRKVVYATCTECKISLIARRIFRFISIFMFGALVAQIFVDTIKLLTGYQRPYFLSLCNVSLPGCTAPLEHSPSPSPHLACNYQNADELRYAWLTFPSLHAAFSSYSACFASCYIYYMINLRGAPLLRPMLIFGLIGMALVDSFSRINGYKNHWRDIWVGWLIGFGIALFLCHSVLCFQEIYHTLFRMGASVLPAPPAPEPVPAPFFSWFRLPRVRAPSIKEEYVLYEEDVPVIPTSTPPTGRHRRNRDRTYEVTTTTESFHRTIVPPADGATIGQRDKSGSTGGGYAAPY